MNIVTTTGVGFSSGMPKPLGSTTTNPLKLATSFDRHMQIGKTIENPEHLNSSFANALNQALGNVEELNQRSEDLTNKAIYEPDTVEAHEVLIAAQKSRFALNLTKTVADGVVRSFRELTNPR